MTMTSRENLCTNEIPDLHHKAKKTGGSGGGGSGFDVKGGIFGYYFSA